MKRAFLAGIGAAIIMLILGTTVFVQGKENINPIQKQKVSSETELAIEQPKEITPELKLVLYNEVHKMVNLSKELALKPVIISKVKLVLDHGK